MGADGGRGLGLSVHAYTNKPPNSFGPCWQIRLILTPSIKALNLPFIQPNLDRYADSARWTAFWFFGCNN